MERYEYRIIHFMPKVSIAKQETVEGLFYTLVMQQQEHGFEFYRFETLPYEEPRGCLNPGWDVRAKTVAIFRSRRG